MAGSDPTAKARFRAGCRALVQPRAASMHLREPDNGVSSGLREVVRTGEVSPVSGHCVSRPIMKAFSLARPRNPDSETQPTDWEDKDVPCGNPADIGRCVM
jgi:hypothetical protein